MPTNQLPNQTVNITSKNEELWVEFLQELRSRGLTRTKAVDQAVRLWLDAVRGTPPQGAVPQPVSQQPAPDLAHLLGPAAPEPVTVSDALSRPPMTNPFALPGSGA